MIENQLQQNILANLTHGKSVAFAVRCIARFLIFVLVFVSAFHTLPQPKFDLTTGKLTFEPAVQQAFAAGTTTIFISTTASTTWTVPADWNNVANQIHVIGAGGGGGRADTNSPWDPSSGGGGGGYSSVSNVTLTPGGDVTIAVGSGGAGATTIGADGGDGGDTYVCNSTSNCASIGGSAVVVGANGGAGGVVSDPTPGGAGGGTGTAVGTVKYAGGDGGDGNNSSSYHGGGGGGGAAGPNGAGGAGGDGESNSGNASGGGGGGADGGTAGSAASTDLGGDGGENKDGSGGGAGRSNLSGLDGSSGGGGAGGAAYHGAGHGGDGQAIWTQTSDSATAGPGGGGGAAGSGDTGTGAPGGGDGGTYGGGGGGTSENTYATSGYGGDGGQGLIVIQYIPDSIPVWNASDWTLYDTVTIKSSQVDSTLTDFPVYVDLSDLSSQFWSTTPSGTSTVGTDIRVTNSSNQELPRELVFASSTAQTGELHFKADTISSSVNTEFRIWYNGSTAGDYPVDATYGAQNVWTNEYLGVWHMNDDPTGTIYDSTSYNRDGSSSGSMTSGDVVTGQVGNAINFDGNDAIDTGNLESMTLDAISIEAWARPTTIAGVSWRELAYAGGTFGLRMLGSGARYSLAVSHSTLYGDWWSPGSSATEGSFQYVYTGRADMTNTASNGVFYIDAVSQTVTEDSTPSGSFVQPNGTQAFDLGTSFIGDLDEIRLASTTRSAAWIGAQYVNHSTTTDFYTAAAYTPPPPEQVQVWNSSLWTAYDTITIDSSYVGANLTNFPVYVDLSDLSASFWSTTPSTASLTGTDIRVTNAANQELPRELVTASYGSQTGELHFKADAISSSTDTTFKIWYNGSTAGDYTATSTYGAENVWTNDYIAVYHMQEDPTTTVLDSTSNSLDSTGYGAAIQSNDLVAGKLGGYGYDFADDSTTYINFGSPALLDNLGANSEVTFSTWYNHTDYGPTYNESATFWSKSAGGSNGSMDFTIHNDSISCFESCVQSLQLYNRYNDEREMEYVPSSGWDYLVSSWDGADSDTGITLYVDGDAASTYEISWTNSGTIDDSSQNAWIGNYGDAAGTDGYYPVVGQMDEFRISSTSRSAAWIAAEYVNQGEPSLFYKTSTAQRVETVSYTSATTGTSWEVPAGVTEVTVYTWGAGGGGGAGGGDSTSSNGGKGAGGGFAQGTVSVTPAETLTVKVGGGGGGGDWATDDGGGSAGAGGYSGVFRSTTPLVMAGGGGGGGGGSQDNVTDPSGGDGGAGGGLVGITGGHATSTSVTGGTGGTQSAGGSAGTGGDSNGEAGETDGRYEGGDGVQSSNTGLGAAGAAGTNGGGAGAIGSSANRNASGAGGGGYYGGGSGGSGAAGGGGGGGGSSYTVSTASATTTIAGDDRGVGNGSHPYRTGTAGQGGHPGIGGTTEAEGDGETGDDGQVVISYTVPSGTTWNSTDWTEYDTIKIRRENIDEPLTDFPVYVDLADLSSNFWNRVSDGGGDIRVTTDSSVPTEVPREVVFASTTAQTGELHFKASYISDVVDTSFRIYYNGSAIDYDTDQAYGAQNVWSNEYVAVYHLNEEGNTTSDGYVDSTSYGHHGTGVSMTGSSDVTGKMGAAQDFDGTADYINIADAVTNRIDTNDFTTSAWIKPPDTNQAGFYLSKRFTGTGFSQWDMGVGSAGSGGSFSASKKLTYFTISFYPSLDEYGYTTADVADNSWRYTTMVREGSNYVAQYIDGKAAANTVVAEHGAKPLDIDSTAPWQIGYGNGAYFYDGYVDEVRIASASRSAAWISAEYQNQATTTGFYTLSAVQASGLGDTNVIIITDTSSTTWAVPSDWNSEDNTIEVIGGGGGGGEGSGGIIGSGGGGGAYSKSVNVTLTPGSSVAMQIGGGGAVTTAGEDTYICGSTSNCASIGGTAVVAGAKGGGAGNTGTNIDGGTGGSTATGYAEADGVEDATGSQKYSGGNGGHAGFNGGSGGGGAAGPNGIGANGGNTTSWGGGGGGGNGGGSVGSNSSSAVGADGGDNVSATGGGTGGSSANGTAGSSGGGGGGGADNYSGGDGGNGTEWTTAGSGGGGGGAGSGGGGGDGGLYGAGGGGESDYGAGAGVGAQGVIVITYTPVAPASIGSSTIANHDAGQVGNAFTTASQTNEPLFAFKITPESGSMTVNRIEFEISGINTRRLDMNDFTNIRLYQDDDNDAAYDVGDTQVGGSGTITLWKKNGQYAYLTFESDFSLSSAENYVVVADWTAPERGAHMKVDLKSNGLDMSDTAGPVIVDGSVSHVQHRLSSSGSGGGGSAIGGDAPAGDGDLSGGVEGSDDEGSDSGGAIDTNTGGATIGTETDYFWPTAAGSGTWTTSSNAYDKSDGTYANTSSDSATQIFTTFGDSVPGTDTIEGISVKMEVSGTTAAGTIDVELSWDSGSTWTSAKTSPALGTTDTVIILGGSADKWGRSWTPAEIGNFQLRVTANPSSNTVQIDELQVKIHHQATGGGGGGGGAI